LCITSFAFIDEDLDGVDDSVDKCPNTPFDQLVNKYGCPLKKEEKVGSFYLKIGGGFIDYSSDNTYFSVVSIAYSIKDFYFSVSPIFYLNNNGTGDISLYGSYSKFLENLFINFGLTAQITTDNSGLDIIPSITLDYFYKDFDFFIYYSYTVKTKSNLKNENELSLGSGYQFNERFYMNGAVNFIFNGSAKSYLSIFGLWDLTDRYFFSFTFNKGINTNNFKYSFFTSLGIKL
jgi:hypothetical protein